MPNEERCNGCRKKEANRLWRLANPGAMAATAKKWRAAGNKTVRPEGYAEQQRLRKLDRYRTDVEVREKAKTTAARRRKEKPEQVKAEVRAWVDKNRVKVRLYARDYAYERQHSDPAYHQRSLLAQSMWRLRNWAKDPQSNSWVRHMENQAIDPAWRARLHVWQENRCYICNRLSAKPLTIEHILPRDRGGPTVKQNIVFTCESCNYSRRKSIWWTEWRPRETLACDTGLTVRYATVSAALDAAGLGGNLDPESGAFILQTNRRESRPLYVLSTFMCSERNTGSGDGRLACRLQEQFPAAIILFDYEWYGRQQAVLNMLRSKMGIASKYVGARETTVAEVSADDASAFLRQNHVMGTVDAPLRIGLVNDGNLCGVGAFADHGDTYECVRLAFDGHVPGGMSRIVQGLWRLHGRREVTSFIDTRYATGGGHDTIGFKATGRTPETYLWVLPDRVQHQRYLSNDNKMSRSLLYFNPEVSREDNIRANGIFRVWVPGRISMSLEA
jgi:hypothetical protein